MRKAIQNTGKGTAARYHALRLKGLPPADAIRPSARDASVDKAVVELAELNSARRFLMYGAERELIEANKQAQHGKTQVSVVAPDIGIALSGGGIRSAAFSLGVLRGLHDIKVLDRVGYLSTVSGGGYAGGWYMTHGPDSELFAPGSRHIKRIVQSGHYLLPANFSKSLSETAWQFAKHVVSLPTVWTLNFLVDTQANWPSHLRGHYRESLARAFLYDHVEDRNTASYPEHAYTNLTDDKWLKSLYLAWQVPTKLFDWLKFPFALFYGLEATAYRQLDWSWIYSRMPGTLKGWMPMSSLAGARGSNGKPFWIANGHVSLIDDSAVDNRNRSGDAFEMTPLRAGSDNVGYVHAAKSGIHDATWQRIGSVIAISGAALDSSSLKQGPVLSAALLALGLDQGYWVNGWGDGWVQGDSCFSIAWNNTRWWLEAVAPVRWASRFFFGPTSHDRHRGGKSFLLTDGGHFDNTGLYALARRGCRLIIVVDATAEPGLGGWEHYSASKRASYFADLHDASAKIQTDFGATIEMNWDEFDPRSQAPATGLKPLVGPQLMMNGAITNLPVVRRIKDSKVCAEGGVAARGIQDVSSEAEILYFRSAYHLAGKTLRSQDTYVDHTKALVSAFPNVATSDQSYDEPMMLSMMQLGYDAVIGNRDAILQKFARVESNLAPRRTKSQKSEPSK